MKMTVIAVAALGLTGSFGVAVAGDAAAGKLKFAVCAGCHGPTGAGNEALKYPKLAGRDAAFVSQQLRAFKSGARDKRDDESDDSRSQRDRYRQRGRIRRHPEIDIPRSSGPVLQRSRSGCPLHRSRMTEMKKTLIASIASLALFGTAFAAGDIEAGKTKSAIAWHATALTVSARHRISQTGGSACRLHRQAAQRSSRRASGSMRR